MRDDVALSAEAAAHAEFVRSHIEAEIAAAGGWISFEHYMELALYAPALGYYSAGASKLGSGGDFTTAPEVSGLFSACIARQCAEVLRGMVNGAIMEVGAGSGRMAVDTLTRLESLGHLPQRYWILEVSADLRERQRHLVRERVPHLESRLQWLDAPPVEPFDGVILANEVLDALPVARFRWSESACEELGVAAPDGSFGWSARPAGESMAAACGALAAAAGGWDDGYVSEYCPRLKPWTGTIVDSLREGAVLWFDYGLPRRQYYLPERHEGTLICHFRQRAFENPFVHPGLRDISAWVDFTALAEACGDAGCELAGFTTQAYFLAGLGIDEEMRIMTGGDEEMRNMAGGDEVNFSRLANEAKQLMLPGAMGERFKAMAWTRGDVRPLSGFALQDLRHSL